MTDINGARAAVPVDASGVPLALALDASIQQVKTAVQSVVTAIQAQTELDALFVTDGTNFYVRREVQNEGTGAFTVTFVNLDGSAPGSQPNVANLKPVNAVGLSVDVVNYDIIAAGTGTAVGDVVSRVLIFNPASPTVAPTSVWFNVTQGTVLTTAPAANALIEQVRNILLDGTDPASPAQANAGTGSRGWLATIAGLLRLGTATKANSASITIATDQGNIEPGGAPITGQAMPAGGVGHTGWLSAIVAAIQTLTNRNPHTAPQIVASLAANGVLVDTVNQQAASPGGYPYFGASFKCTQGATGLLQGSVDGTTYYTIQSVALAAGVPASAKIPTNGWNYFRAYVQNGGTAAAAGGDGIAAFVTSSFAPA